ncbi:MAG: hypothetical protein JNJ65_04625 [Cyclobacteriaceae bacterium]|jgi:hypothetical protein|nr:hypothetical protein [Cyclobacteriaceae bacterium]
MRAESESYKGIEYVRISHLPTDQQEKITASLSRDVVIKILKDGNIIDDCIPYSEYLHWFEQHQQGSVIRPAPAHPQGIFKLSIK